MKKLLSVIMSIYLAAMCMCAFVGCDGVDKFDGKGETPTVHTYYAYDVEMKEYEDEDYMTVTDTVVAWCSSDVGSNSTIEFNGSVAYSGKKFTMTLTGSFTVLDTCVVTFRGERESDGVLRIDNMVFTTYSDFADNPTVITDNEVMYYCKKGSKPENPVQPIEPIEPIDPPEAECTVTIHGNGGTFSAGTLSGYEKFTRLTDENGRIPAYSYILIPTREGYVYKEYNFKPDGTGATVDGNTVFTKDTDIYAIWAKEITVTFKDGDTTIKTQKIGVGDKLGNYQPPLPGNMAFVGWYDSDGTLYTSGTVMYRDVTLTAKWRTLEEVERQLQEYLQNLSVTSQAGHMYIHYRRLDHKESEEGTVNSSAAPTYNSPIKSDVYGDWALWAWPKDGWGRTFNAARIDFMGAMYDVDLTYTFTDCGWDGINKVPMDYQNKLDTATIGIHLFKLSSRQTEGFWANDGGDNYIANLPYNHIFVLEGLVKYPSFYNSFTGEFKD